MNYKLYEKDSEIFFRYMPRRSSKKNERNLKFNDSPFKKLERLNIK